MTSILWHKSEIMVDFSLQLVDFIIEIVTLPLSTCRMHMIIVVSKQIYP